MARFLHSIAVATAALAVAFPAIAQRSGMTPEAKERRFAIERELQSVAVVQRKLMIPMRDGIRVQADIYHPKDSSKRYPAIWVRTPYGFNYWDVLNGVPRDMSAQLEAIKRGYAWVDMQERGRNFSEGIWDILGPPVADGEDALAYLIGRPWSNGKVGVTGCSSTAEWQGAVAARGLPGFAAMNPQAYGAGIGKVGPYYEMGNWYRGGAVQMLFITWLGAMQVQIRPNFPPNTSREDLEWAGRLYDLTPRAPPIDWAKALWHLPMQDLLRAVDGPTGIYADSVPGIATGGAMVKRTPNDSAWYRGGLWHETMPPINVPGLWVGSWFDVSIAPNIEMYNQVRKTARPDMADRQWMIVAPTSHCAFERASEKTMVGERDLGDARLDYDDIRYAFFDRFLKDRPSPRIDTMPKVTYYVMGLNRWKTSDVWPPREARPMTFYLSSGGNANTLNGDGALAAKPPAADRPDTFTYDPANPVPSHGGNACCQGNATAVGSMDQRKMEERPDILVYTSEVLRDGLELTGPIVPTLYVSSSAKDTDFTIKIIDVYPDGRAFNIDETIQRVRWREGYDKPPVFMEQGKVYKVPFQPMVTSNWFAPGHRIRIEVSSSNFPRFDRNLNTGGDNYSETRTVVARNRVHHSRQYPSSLAVSVIPSAGPTK